MRPTLSPWFKVAAVAGAAVLAYARWVERLRIEVQRMVVAVDAAGVPPQGLRVLHLSDLHFTGRGLIERWKIERTVRLLANEPVDLLLITGDLIHDDHGIPAAMELIRRLPRPRLGAFACLGNHDYAAYSWFGPARVAWREAEPGRRLQAAIARTVEMALRIVRNDRLYLGQEHNDVERLKAALAGLDVTVLQNSSAGVQQDGAHLWLAGVDDLMEGRPDVAAAVRDMPPNGSLRVLLAHNPDLMLEPPLQQADLAFSGHVHGGQVLIPLLGALHTQGTHLSRRRTWGWFRYGRAQTYVTRGLGEGVRLRFRCRPEVALVHVLPADASAAQRHNGANRAVK
ncbi:MAG: metallophosphoesterase [Caldilineales bacterium]|nr:metallophosphoesterase [Caldilineales bacterium]MDW8318533.1 metallophosphoesterase [Anaerolineae bacterium]